MVTSHPGSVAHWGVLSTEATRSLAKSPADSRAGFLKCSTCHTRSLALGRSVDTPAAPRCHSPRTVTARGRLPQLPQNPSASRLCRDWAPRHRAASRHVRTVAASAPAGGSPSNSRSAALQPVAADARRATPDGGLGHRSQIVRLAAAGRFRHTGHTRSPRDSRGTLEDPRWCAAGHNVGRRVGCRSRAVAGRPSASRYFSVTAYCNTRRSQSAMSLPTCRSTSRSSTASSR